MYPRHGPPVKRSQPLHDHLLKRRPVKQCVNKIQNVKQKIVIIGDSHSRNSAAELKHIMGSSFTISSFVKPGAGMGSIVESMKDIKKLKGDDVIIWGGSNDIAKNNSNEALKHVCNFVKKQSSNEHRGYVCASKT